MSDSHGILDELRAILVDPDLPASARVVTALLRLSVDKSTRELRSVDTDRLAQALGAKHRNRVADALKPAIAAGLVEIVRVPNKPNIYRMPMTQERLDYITSHLLPLAKLHHQVLEAPEPVARISGQPESRATEDPGARESGRPMPGNPGDGRPEIRATSYMQDSSQDSLQDKGASPPSGTTSPLGAQSTTDQPSTSLHQQQPSEESRGRAWDTLSKQMINKMPDSPPVPAGTYRLKPDHEVKTRGGAGPLRHNPALGTLEFVNGQGEALRQSLLARFPGINIEAVLAKSAPRVAKASPGEWPSILTQQAVYEQENARKTQQAAKKAPKSFEQRKHESSF